MAVQRIGKEGIEGCRRPACGDVAKRPLVGERGGAIERSMAGQAAHPGVEPAALIGPGVTPAGDTRRIERRRGRQKVGQRFDRSCLLGVIKAAEHLRHRGAGLGGMRLLQVGGEPLRSQPSAHSGGVAAEPWRRCGGEVACLALAGCVAGGAAELTEEQQACFNPVGSLCPTKPFKARHRGGGAGMRRDAGCDNKRDEKNPGSHEGFLLWRAARSVSSKSVIKP